jgi:hypothetical protein
MEGGSLLPVANIQKVFTDGVRVCARMADGETEYIASEPNLSRGEALAKWRVILEGKDQPEPFPPGSDGWDVLNGVLRDLDQLRLREGQNRESIDRLVELIAKNARDVLELKRAWEKVIESTQGPKGISVSGEVRSAGTLST